MSGRRAFTLLELLVSTFVLVVIMVITTQLLFTASEQRVLFERAQPPPAVSLAMLQLRHDAAASEGVSGGGSIVWKRSPLVLRHADGGRLRYRLSGRELVREHFASGSFTASGSRLMVPDVTTFRWQTTDSLLLVEVERTSFLGAVPRPGRPLPPGLLLDSRAIAVRMRGTGGNWW